MNSKKNRQKLNNASTPSGIPTNDITQIYDLPCDEFQTAGQVAEAYGFKLMLNEKPLGVGGFAKVVKARRLDNDSIVAVKIMDISGKSAKKLKIDAKNELFILEKTNHPHIIRVFTHFIVHMKAQQKNSVYIFMKMAENGSLSEFLRQAKTGFQEPHVRKWFAQVVSAVAHMHSNGIAHRDLKLGNILLDQNLDVKVADFGLSRVSYRKKVGTIMSTEFKGTITYMAPEILRIKLEKDKPSDEITDMTEETDKSVLAYNTFFADVWALGVILFTIVNRKYLFDIDKKPEQKVTQEDYVFMYNQQKNFDPHKMVQWSRYWPKKCPEYEDMIKKIFVFDPKARIKITEMCEHPWIVRDINEINDKIKAKLQKEKASPKNAQLTSSAISSQFS